MVRLPQIGTEVLEKPKPYQRNFKPQKAASKLTKKETLEYFLECDIPKHFASPWPKRTTRDEYRIGMGGSLVYHGDLDAGRDYKRSHATNAEDSVELDTYFNKVMIQAVKNGWINIYLEKGCRLSAELTPMMFSDIYSNRISEGMKKGQTEIAEEIRQREFYENQQEFMSPGPMVAATLMMKRVEEAGKLTEGSHLRF